MKTSILILFAWVFLFQISVFAQQKPKPKTPVKNPASNQLVVVNSVNHQLDWLILKDKTKSPIVGQVVEIGATEVKYRKGNNPQGPILRIAKSSLLKIERGTGSIPPSELTLAEEIDTTWGSQKLMQTILDSLRSRPNLKGMRIKLKNINFETNSVQLTLSSQAYLDTIALVLNKIPALVFEIAGHTDNTGQEAYNLKLSQDRASAVQNHLILKGQVAATRVSSQGYGWSRPILPNISDANRRQNRRVEMEMVGLDQAQKNVIVFRDGHSVEALLVYQDEARGRVVYKIDENSPLLEVTPDELARIEFADKNVIVFNEIKREEIAQIYTQPPAPKPRKAFAVSVFGEGLYVIESLSPQWSNIQTGIGMLQGFGGGLMFNFYLSKRVGFTVQGGYSKWMVERRYVSPAPEKELQYTADETLTRIPVQLGVKLYPFHNAYFHVFGGGQLLKRVTATSELHPLGLQTLSTQSFQPAVGGALGFEKYFGSMFIDFAAQYNLVLTNSFQEITDPLHFAGIRIGLGFKRKAIQ